MMANLVTYASMMCDADGNGSIPIFGGGLCILPSTLWLLLVERLLRRADPMRSGAAEDAIRAAAAGYCYRLAHGVMESPEFMEGARAAGQEPRGRLEAFLSLMAAWGWADAETAFLEPGKKLVVHARAYFEADIRDTFQSARPLAFMLSGMCGALMDLLFAAPFPRGLASFTCTQTRGIECGDRYGEFVVTGKDAL